MPHGVRFRGGKEKLIREIFLEHDVMEALIRLPPNLFYGTGIPACVFVCEQEQIGRIAGQSIFHQRRCASAAKQGSNALRQGSLRVGQRADRIHRGGHPRHRKRDSEISGTRTPMLEGCGT